MHGISLVYGLKIASYSSTPQDHQNAINKVDKVLCSMLSTRGYEFRELPGHNKEIKNTKGMIKNKEWWEFDDFIFHYKFYSDSSGAEIFYEYAQIGDHMNGEYASFFIVLSRTFINVADPQQACYEPIFPSRKEIDQFKDFLISEGFSRDDIVNNVGSFIVPSCSS